MVSRRGRVLSSPIRGCVDRTDPLGFRTAHGGSASETGVAGPITSIVDIRKEFLMPPRAAVLRSLSGISAGTDQREDRGQRAGRRPRGGGRQGHQSYGRAETKRSQDFHAEETGGQERSESRREEEEVQARLTRP